MIAELASLGLDFPRWQDALEAAHASGALQVSGEVRDGQVLQYDDPSGARLIILAVEPYGAFAGLYGGISATGHISMVNDVVGVIDVVADSPELQTSGQSAPVVASVTASVAQGPSMADAATLEYQQLQIAALGVDVATFDSPAAFASAGGGELGVVESAGMADLNSGARAPHAGARIAVEATDVVKRTNALTGQDFWLATVQQPFEFTVALPASAIAAPPAPGHPLIVSGTVHMTATAVEAAGCSPGGCGSGACGCGGH
ncbi:MAG TPA: hypothetical protein H9867_02150 [Candidatus Corynebacterium gallistercoris]|uniref:Uncharacterized protein n=1 Tax=Candidatus Corynebacterium gallistercoris TaxID=2838530 RepID=A0A9D1UQR8_9CORY|nr:hypothetical protein [Candidatus Corynebacterium gallistercoris]